MVGDDGDRTGKVESLEGAVADGHRPGVVDSARSARAVAKKEPPGKVAALDGCGPGIGDGTFGIPVEVAGTDGQRPGIGDGTLVGLVGVDDAEAGNLHGRTAADG